MNASAASKGTMSLVAVEVCEVGVVAVAVANVIRSQNRVMVKRLTSLMSLNFKW